VIPLIEDRVIYESGDLRIGWSGDLRIRV